MLHGVTLETVCGFLLAVLPPMVNKRRASIVFSYRRSTVFANKEKLPVPCNVAAACVRGYDESKGAEGFGVRQDAATAPIQTGT